MNRIVVILLSLSMVCCSGCVELGYKTEVTVSLFKQTELTARPVIVDDGYPIPTVEALKEVVEKEEIVTPISTERRGFKKFKKRAK